MNMLIPQQYPSPTFVQKACTGSRGFGSMVLPLKETEDFYPFQCFESEDQTVTDRLLSAFHNRRPLQPSKHLGVKEKNESQSLQRKEQIRYIPASSSCLPSSPQTRTWSLLVAALTMILNTGWKFSVFSDVAHFIFPYFYSKSQPKHVKASYCILQMS